MTERKFLDVSRFYLSSEALTAKGFKVETVVFGRYEGTEGLKVYREIVVDTRAGIRSNVCEGVQKAANTGMSAIVRVYTRDGELIEQFRATRKSRQRSFPAWRNVQRRTPFYWE